MSEKWVLRTELARDDWQVNFEPENEEDETCDYGNTVVFDETGRTICLVVSAPYSDHKLDHNASLIVAAPENAEVSRALVAFDTADFATLEQMQAALSDVIAMARAAVAKMGDK